jgi:CRP-like cAMP-binding protein
MTRNTGVTHASVANRLLRALDEAAFEPIAPHLKRVDLKRGDIIYRSDALIEHVYFVEKGMVSLIKTMGDGRIVEIGAIGIEGVTGSNALFGVRVAILESIVQIEGAALRISCEALRAELVRSEALRGVMERYAHLAISQLAQTAACNRLHRLEQRCCRWLLIAHDSARADTFSLTHEFLAMMLGVHRAGVTLAAKELQSSGLITYARGRVTIEDRAGLEAAACECYPVMRAQADQLFPAKEA